MSVMRQLMGLSTWARCTIAFLIVWALLVFIFATRLNAPGGADSPSVAHAMQRIDIAIAHLEHQRQANDHLRTVIDQLVNNKAMPAEQRQKLLADLELQQVQMAQHQFGSGLEAGQSGVTGGTGEPTLEYEQLRRRVYSNTQEMWRFVQHEVQQLRSAVGNALTAATGGSVAGKAPAPLTNDQLNRQFDEMLSLAAEHKSALLNDMDRLREADGYESWRHRESRELSDLVQRRLTALQNPSDCGSAQKLVCRLNKVSELI